MCLFSMIFSLPKARSLPQELLQLTGVPAAQGDVMPWGCPCCHWRPQQGSPAAQAALPSTAPPSPASPRAGHGSWLTECPELEGPTRVSKALDMALGCLPILLPGLSPHPCLWKVAELLV